MGVSSDYLSTVLCPSSIKTVVDGCCKRLKPHAAKFQAIAFRGMSGCLVAPWVAAKLKKHMLMVRKGKSHSTNLVEGELTVDSYIILDDFMDSGNTVKQIVNRIAMTRDAKMVGACFYNKPELNSKTRELLKKIVGNRVFLC